MSIILEVKFYCKPKISICYIPSIKNSYIIHFSIKIFNFYFMYMNVWIFVYVVTRYILCANGNEKTASDYWELDLLVVISHIVRAESWTWAFFKNKCHLFRPLNIFLQESLEHLTAKTWKHHHLCFSLNSWQIHSVFTYQFEIII